MDFYDELIDRTERERRQLLSIPLIGEALAGRVDRETYIAFLREAYHHVKHTVPLLMACGARLPERLEWLRSAVADYISEETGHQEWILQDIAAAGANADAVRNGQPSEATDVMVAYAWDTVQRRNPVGFFGMVLVLEGTSVAIANDAAGAIRATTDLPASAFRYLTSHGALDQQHMKTFAGLMNRLEEAEDREAVVRTARVMFRLYGDIFRLLDGGRRREAA